MTLEKHPVLKQLSASEKVILAEELWADAGDDERDIPLSTEQEKLLNDRWDAYLKDPSTAVSLEDVKA